MLQEFSSLLMTFYYLIKLEKEKISKLKKAEKFTIHRKKNSKTEQEYARYNFTKIRKRNEGTVQIDGQIARTGHSCRMWSEIESDVSHNSRYNKSKGKGTLRDCATRCQWKFLWNAYTINNILPVVRQLKHIDQGIGKGKKSLLQIKLILSKRGVPWKIFY